MSLIYKYYGFHAGLTALENHTLGFRNPDQFNDPLESQLWLRQNDIELNCLGLLKEAIGVLSMTLNPLNPLMWSHYAEEHRGIVIGYDITDPIFGPQRDTVISAASGKVFFEQEIELAKPDHAALKAAQWVQMGMNGELPTDYQAALRHILLLKHRCWEYEGEVRIVKLRVNFAMSCEKWAQETDHCWQQISKLILPKVGLAPVPGLFTVPCRASSIKRVILGMRNPLIADDVRIETSEALSQKVEIGGWSVEVADWTSEGDLIARASARPIRWGYPKIISSKTLAPGELEAIASKLPNERAQTQELVVTTEIDGTHWAHFRDELQQVN
ncbi:MAG: DUF2971 domain-containing protein [Rhodomicrobiaceae bacterium]